MLAVGKVSIDVTRQFKLRNVFVKDLYNFLWFKYIRLLNNVRLNGGFWLKNET